MKRIVFVLVSTGLGGAEKQAVLLAQQFKKKIGYEIIMVCIGDKPGLLTDHLQNFGIKYHLVNCLFPASKLKTILGFLKLLIVLRKLKPTILLPYTYVPNVMVGIIWRFTQAKKCIWNQRDEGFGVGATAINSFAIKNVSGFIANSTGGKNYLTNIFDVKKKIYLVPNAILYSEEPGREKKSINDIGVPCILTMVANLSRNKDHKTIIIGFKKLLERFDYKITLLLAGRFDDQYTNLTNLVKNLGLERHVVFLGEVDDIPSLLRKTDISILSSYSEGFSNSVLESMSLGVPVVASDIEGVKEVVGNDYEYLFEPGNSNDFETKMEYLISSDINRKKVIERNYERVKNYFTVEKLAANSYNAIEEF